MRYLFVALLATCLCAPLVAQDDPLKVGDVAPDFGATRWLATPRRTTLEEMKGEVVLLKAWGID